MDADFIALHVSKIFFFLFPYLKIGVCTCWVWENVLSLPHTLFGQGKRIQVVAVGNWFVVFGSNQSLRQHNFTVLS